MTHKRPPKAQFILFQRTLVQLNLPSSGWFETRRWLSALTGSGC